VVLREVLGEEGEENSCGGAAPSVGVGEFEHHDVVELESGRLVNCGAGGSVGGGHDSIGRVCVADGRMEKEQEWEVVEGYKSVKGNREKEMTVHALRAFTYMSNHHTFLSLRTLFRLKFKCSKMQFESPYISGWLNSEKFL
jgi:hypothetical protein